MKTVLMRLLRQSKLSQDELNQLQRDTHFDKKELQHWYKGELSALSNLYNRKLTGALL